jgi:hypothetical protein
VIPKKCQATSLDDELLFRIGMMAMMNNDPDILITEKMAEVIRYTDVIAEINVNSEDGDDILIFDDVVSRQMEVSGGNGSEYGVGTVLTTRGYLSWYHVTIIIIWW